MAKRKTTAKGKYQRPPRGQVGPQTYEQIRKIVAAKAVPLVKAFEEVAKATGRKASTVAVTYYKIARQQGAPRGKRRGRPPGKGSGGALRNPRLKAVLSRAAGAIRELEGLIARQAHEIARLKDESKLADRIRKALRE